MRSPVWGCGKRSRAMGNARGFQPLSMKCTVTPRYGCCATSDQPSSVVEKSTVAHLSRTNSVSLWRRSNERSVSRSEASSASHMNASRDASEAEASGPIISDTAVRCGNLRSGRRFATKARNERLSTKEKGRCDVPMSTTHSCLMSTAGAFLPSVVTAGNESPPDDAAADTRPLCAATTCPSAWSSSVSSW